MRMFVIFIVLGCGIGYATDSYSQTTVLSLNVENKTVKEVFTEIEKNSEYIFFYYDGILDLERKVTLHMENKKIDVILDELFENTDNYHVISDRQITIARRQEAILLPLVEEAAQQGITITGKVADTEGLPMPGVTILLKGTTRGTASDSEGRFSITVPDQNAILVFSFIGYIVVEQTVGNRTVMNITLQEAVAEFEEVVVIGYGTVRKRDMTGAVSTIKAGDITYSAAASVGHSIMGKAAGMFVRQNSAQPGGGLDILIRGAGSVNAGNSPLYVVDGFPIITYDQPGANASNRLDPGRQGVLNFINPNDIASIEIMKDASATAIYGSRAANGVVLITTRRGKEGKPTVGFTASYGVQKHTDIYELLSVKEWMQERNVARYDAWLFRNTVFPYGTTSLEQAMANPNGGIRYVPVHTEDEIRNAGEGTDWLSLVTWNGKVEQYDASLQGGTTATKYMASLGYFNQQGIIRNNQLRRYTGRFNFDQDIGKYFKASMNILASRVNSDNVPLGGGLWEQQGLIRSALVMPPNIKARNEDGTYPINPYRGVEPNPVSLLEVTDNTITDRALLNGSITAEPIKNLLIKFSSGLDFSDQERGYYMPTSTLWGANVGGLAQIWTAKKEQSVSEFTINYTFDLNTLHKFTALAGYSFEKTKLSNRFLGNNNFIIDGFKFNNIGAGTGTRSLSSSASENKMASYFGRINYTLLDRYLFTATLRADGASVFARNNKWGYFPSVAVGWNMIEEKFMASTRNILNMLKWRASYGQTGNANISSNAFAAYATQAAWDNESGSRIMSVYQSRLENPDLKWETTTEWNIGLDVSSSALNGISISLEYYNRIISDLLQTKPLNTYQAINAVMANIGKTQSRGFEITLNTRNISMENFTWNTDLTFTIYKDKWYERAPDWKPNVYQNVNDPIRADFSRKALRILQIGDPIPTAQPLLKPGQIVIEDRNGYLRDAAGNPVVDENGKNILTGAPDDRIDDADTYLLGSQDPGCYAGMNNKFSYRRFDLNFYLYGMFDRMIQDPTFASGLMDPTALDDWGYNQLRDIKNRWLPDNPSTTIRSYHSSTYGVGDWHFEKAWFIRMANISLGYSIPNQKVSHIFSSFRVHFDVNNVFVITPYKGLDPETDVDHAAYPNARTFTFGVDLKF